MATDSAAEASAVVRQPKVCIVQATAGTKTPPSARPMLIVESANARFFSNHCTTATVSGK